MAQVELENYFANFIHMKLSSNNPDTFINMNENLMNENDLLNSHHYIITLQFILMILKNLII